MPSFTGFRRVFTGSYGVSTGSTEFLWGEKKEERRIIRTRLSTRGGGGETGPPPPAPQPSPSRPVTRKKGTVMNRIRRPNRRLFSCVFCWVSPADPTGFIRYAHRHDDESFRTSNVIDGPLFAVNNRIRTTSLQPLFLSAPLRPSGRTFHFESTLHTQRIEMNPVKPSNCRCFQKRMQNGRPLEM